MRPCSQPRSAGACPRRECSDIEAAPNSPPDSGQCEVHLLFHCVQEWLDERLAHMGFVFRSFPQLLPLDLLLDLGAGETTDGVDASSLCTSHDFAEWARTSGGSLPLLASQWHDVDR